MATLAIVFRSSSGLDVAARNAPRSRALRRKTRIRALYLPTTFALIVISELDHCNPLAGRCPSPSAAAVPDASPPTLSTA
ncbi:hypothetical protein B0H16DRAFT_1748346 [Mycena metata]|uniref:Uncharacterized protein n=1 Tax=Mycena metata TaxID=1033252 RepID=A0AAD7DY89_9AGAR|nr:hypothetical protein B0H16DRAFT_1748346 [Mycena metata]